MASVARGVVCGLIVIDGAQAMLGTIDKHELVERVGRVTSTAASRTRRGGSSAARFARARDGEELAFLRRVVGKVQSLLSEADSLIIGGKADMKRKLLGEMPMALRSVVRLVIPYPGGSDSDGLRFLARRWQGVQQRALSEDVASCVRDFLRLAEHSAGTSQCYGHGQTMSALRVGAVACVLVAHDFSGGSECRSELLSLARATRASIVDVTSDTEEGALFCRGWQVGGLLRWPLEAEDLEDMCGMEEDVDVSCAQVVDDMCALSEASTVDTVNDSWVGSVSSWLARRLDRATGDSSAAESLAAGAEVLLAFDEDSIADRIIQAVELLRGQNVEEAVLEDFVNEVSIQSGLFD